MTLLEFELALELDIWQSMLADYNAYGLAKRIASLDSYRKYSRKYPKDKFAKPVAWEFIIETLEDEAPAHDEVLASKQLIAAYRATLTKRQRTIVDMLSAGYTQPEIAAHLGCKDTAIIRYQKHLAKRKWLAIQG